MEKKKLMSLRLDPEIIRIVDGLLKTNPYWTRSFVINQVLLNICTCADRRTLFDITSKAYAKEKGYLVSFRIDKDTLIDRSKPNYDF